MSDGLAKRQEVDVEELRALHNSASPGPWVAESEDVGDHREWWCTVGPFFLDDWPPNQSRNFVWTIGSRTVVEAAQRRAQADAQLVAATRNALPAMLDEIGRLRARVAELEAEAARHEYYSGESGQR